MAPPMSTSGRKAWWIAGAIAVFALVAVIAALRQAARSISSEELRERIVATIQSEAKQSLLITGSIDMTATVTVENARTLLPGLLDIDVGTSRATVQVPGRAYYGFDVRALDRNKIRVQGDTIHVVVPPPRLISVDANLEQLRVWTQKGWLRSTQSLQSVERTAIQRIDNTLARQAARYISTSAQPRVNSAEAIRNMIEPVLSASGIARPVFRFELDERLKME